MSINNLSSHLFWDIDRDLLDQETHKKFIVQRVLEYGLLSDWVILKKIYTIDEVTKTAVTLRTLEPRALTITHTPLESFRCYSTRQSTIKHWQY